MTTILRALNALLLAITILMALHVSRNSKAAQSISFSPIGDGDANYEAAADVSQSFTLQVGQPVLTRNNVLTLSPAGSATITSNHLQVVAAGIPASQIVYTLVSPLPAKGQVKLNGTLVGWLLNPSTGHYYTSTAPGHRGATASEAASYGAFLTTVNNAAENVWITNNFNRALNAYNGLNDPGGWDNGESSNYRNWHPGEPNSGQETAVHMYLHLPDGEGAQWNDIDPNERVHPGIVERNNSNGILLSFTQEDIDQGRVSYQHFGRSDISTPTDPDDFTFTVSDGAGGHISSTIFQINVDVTAPTADIVDVTPDPRANSVAAITIGFSEAVNDFDLQDLQLSRDGGSNLLSLAQSLTTSDNIIWTLGNLSELTSVPGSYTLTLTATGSGIKDAFGNALAGDSSDTWVAFNLTPQTITFGTLANKTFGDPPFTVNATASSGLPVSFSIVSGPASVTGDTVTITGAGTVVVRASQEGNENYNAATPVAQSFTVSPNGTSTTVSSSANPSVLGQMVTFTATVRSSSGTPTGTVTFKDGETIIGSSGLLGGSAGFTTSILGVGPHPITAQYSGDANSDHSDSMMFFQQVNLICTGTLGFVAAPGSPVGTGFNAHPIFLALGDFNGDGDQDFAVANADRNDVNIKLGNGTGGFVTSSTPSVGSQPVSVAVGDLNGDGKQDLAVANGVSNTVTILLGNGNGGFITSSSPNVGVTPVAIATGDFDQNGKQDLAVANFSSSNVSILLGNGSGGFVPAAGSPVGVGNIPRAMVAGDFNRDGKHDLAVANQSSGNVTILLGTGNGGFTTSSSPGVGSSPKSVALGDFNGDSKQDLAVSNYDSNSVTILLGNGNGTFSMSISPGVGNKPFSVAVGDFDGDGRQDLAAANELSNNVTILRGDGGGEFSVASISPVVVESSPHSVAVGDFDEDGNQDLLVANSGSNNVTILLNTCGDTAPNINSLPVAQVAGEPAANTRIGTVSDAQDASEILTVKVNGGTTATVNGVTVTLNPSSPDTSGQVFADVVASCTATNATFTLGVIDSANQMTTSTLTVTVTPDLTAPLVTAPTPTVASANGSCQAVIPNVIPGTIASDNCGTVTLTQTPAAGALVGVGLHTITVTATDATGNSNTATTTFTVTDTTPPTPNVATLPPITGECSVTLTAPTATDNCAGHITGTTTDPTSYSSQGTFIVHWLYDDGHGNISTQTQTIIVQDITPPAFNQTPSTDGLVAYYKFDEVSGINTPDSLSNSRTGQLIGTSLINTGLPILGFANPSALSFNGTSDYVLIPPSAIDNLSSGTIAAGVYLNTRDQEVITAKQHNNVDSTAVFAVGLSGASNTPSDIQTPGVLYFHAKNATGFNAAGVTSLNTGQWYHVAVTFTTTQAKIYVNGVVDSVTNGDFSIPTDLSGAATTTIGAWLGDGLIDGRGTNYLDGRLDDVRIYHRALSDSEVAAFVSGAPPADITQSTDEASCSAVVTYPTPVATDNCMTPVAVSCDHASGSTFPLGSTIVTCTATDNAGNSSTASFTVTVNDATAPVPNLATLPTVTGECSASIQSPPTATDNCGGQITGTTTDPTSYTTPGTFVVHWNYNDQNGNVSTQTQTVTVQAASISVDAGPDQVFCNNTVVTMAGNTPAGGTGTWTLVSGSGTIAEPNNPSTVISDLGFGSNVFRWTISNGSCGSSSDDVVITRNSCPSVVTLFSSGDSFLKASADNTNEGANERLRLQSAGNNRAAVMFDLTGISTVGLQSATLILTIAENSNNWGASGRLVDAHRLLVDWTEGNGRNDAMVGGGPGFRGTGEGITWNCSKDLNIANQSANCSPLWNGGNYAAATAPGALHTNGFFGEVFWDVTADVLAGANFGWLIRKQNEGQNGQVRYYSREGAVLAGNASLAPRLVLVYSP